MEPDATREAADLSAALSALAFPARILILARLREPRLLSEIVVRADREEPDGRERPLSRQTIKSHLDKLVEAGFVLLRDTDRDGRASHEYVVNHPLLFAYSERFRELASLAPTIDPGVATVAGGGPGRGRTVAPPCLVLVKGLQEGRGYGLAPPPAGDREWVVGRRRGLDVVLDYDPFVSSENCVVAWRGGRHLVSDAPGSRNGTTLNFEPIPAGAEVPLSHGDVIGVGRSLLLFRR